MAHVALEAAGARRWSDQAERLGRPSAGDYPGALEARPDGRAVPQELRPRCFTSRSAARRRSLHLFATVGVDVESNAAGSHEARPKRLPQSRAVRFRKSPRRRPQKDAVGRKPTSFARAPRSPVWLASRSSSSAMPRSACARAARWHPRQSLEA